MCSSEALGGTRTGGSVTNRDRTSEISRGHSRWMQTGEGLKALQFDRKFEPRFTRPFGVRKRERTDKPNRSPIEGPNGPR